MWSLVMNLSSRGFLWHHCISLLIAILIVPAFLILKYTRITKEQGLVSATNQCTWKYHACWIASSRCINSYVHMQAVVLHDVTNKAFWNVHTLRKKKRITMAHWTDLNSLLIHDNNLCCVIFGAILLALVSLIAGWQVYICRFIDKIVKFKSC